MQSNVVRCHTCGRLLLPLYEKYNKLVKEQDTFPKLISSVFEPGTEIIEPKNDVVKMFEENNVKECCRARVLSVNDLDKQMVNY